MTRIYLIRHAEAEGNLYRIAQGQHNSLLTDRGWRQTAALKQRFASEQIDAVYSSDLYRCCATASALYEPRGLELRRRKNLREICVGAWEQRTWGDISREDPELIKKFQNHPAQWHVEGAEAPAQVLERVRREVEAIARAHDGETVAIVSHGYAIRLLLAYAEGRSVEETGETPHGDNSAVSLLEYENGALRVVFRDDNSHLNTPEYTAGQKIYRRATALEPGLWFMPLVPREHGVFLGCCGEHAWEDAGDKREFDLEELLIGALQRTTVVGYLGDDPIGIVQFGPEPDWITLAFIARNYRCRGYGVQLLGQAVQHARAHGREELHMALEKDAPAMAFFAEYGFAPAGELPDGRVVLKKSIAFDPRYLGEQEEV